MNDQAVACLMFGIYDKNEVGIMDRRECSVCKGDSCPYIVEEARHGGCPHCFGTGQTPAGAFDLQNQTESICPHREGTGLV